jgi:hypothetical protein
MNPLALGSSGNLEGASFGIFSRRFPGRSHHEVIVWRHGFLRHAETERSTWQIKM